MCKIHNNLPCGQIIWWICIYLQGRFNSFSISISISISIKPCLVTKWTAVDSPVCYAPRIRSMIFLMPKVNMGAFKTQNQKKMKKWWCGNRYQGRCGGDERSEWKEDLDYLGKHLLVTRTKHISWWNGTPFKESVENILDEQIYLLHVLNIPAQSAPPHSWWHCQIYPDFSQPRITNVGFGITTPQKDISGLSKEI